MVPAVGPSAPAATAGRATPRPFPDAARRARLARRHALHPDHRVGTPAEAAAAAVALHGTDLPSIHLAYAARARDPHPETMRRALETDRDLVVLPAMRRTLFAVPRPLLPAVLGSVSARTAAGQRSALIRDLERHGAAEDGAAWIAAATRAVLAALADGVPRGTAEVRAAVPALAARTTVGPDARRWETPRSFAAPLLGMLTAEGVLARGPNDGGWRSHRQRWTPASAWLGEPATALEPRAGYAALVRGWLGSFGPGTEADLVWWLGATKTAVRAALADVAAVAVALDGGAVGWVLPGDEEPDADPGPWAALLPPLDPLTMGWRDRAFHLPPDVAPHAYDTVGNGTSTAWVDGRIVGTWVQDAAGVVEVLPRVPLTRAERGRLDREAARLSGYAAGLVVPNPYAGRLRAGEPLP